MRQYNQIKAKYPDTILLFRMGDFFETFDDDAHLTAKVCGITLTKRHNGAAGESPLAGFPHHQLDAYLPKLVRAGYRVAVCEQLEDPKKAKGIVKRGVIEVVTPGVALYDKLLETKQNNYIVAIILEPGRYGRKTAGIAAADISTGEFFTCEEDSSRMNEVIESLNPAELLIPKGQKDEINFELDNIGTKPPVTRLEDWIYDIEFGRDLLCRHFKTQNLKGFGIESLNAGIKAAGALMHYTSETQQGNLSQITKISLYNPSEYMLLDFPTRRNLEITFSIDDTKNEGTLISVLDKTITPMGGRLFKKWVIRPLLDKNAIHGRLDAVDAMFTEKETRNKLRSNFKEIGDIERLISKICTGRANPRDIIGLKNSLAKIPGIKTLLSGTNSKFIDNILSSLDPLENLVAMIEEAVLEEPSVSPGTGNIFRPGYSRELDEFIEAKHSGKKWLNDYRDRERETSGIQNLKVDFNSVFGYYIEVTKTHTSKVPDYFIRKQTLTNAERYTTDELKTIEGKILTAEEKILEVEQSLFTELRQKIIQFTNPIQKNAELIAAIDCLAGFAETSAEFGYTKPHIDESGKIEIEEGRHPVVERLLPKGAAFTPNSTLLDIDSQQIHIITGPNMSGKSCYLRQVALIVLLGQIGCFVPAKSAKFGIIDRIFTRVGAQDNITGGESTFLIEMQEAANILNNATSASLVLLDELGRGTATFDGISIAWATAEYLHDVIGAKTLFATHYHELNSLADRYERIVNYTVEVVEAGSTVIFTHTVKPGSSDHSFGIHVAKMAGMPASLVERAGEIMHTLENSTGNETGSGISMKKADISSIETKKIAQDTDQLSIFEFRDDQLREKLLELKINMLTPIQAQQVLADMQKEAKKSRK